MAGESSLTPQELDAIERWCAARLQEHHAGYDKPVPLWNVCDYDPLLPSHSIRSQLLSLVAACRHLMGERDTLRDALADVTSYYHMVEHHEGAWTECDSLVCGINAERVSGVPSAVEEQP